jgi:hypothetical protein
MTMTSELTRPKPETCNHGQLARSCEICDLEQQLAEREKQNVMLRNALKDIKAVAESAIKTHGYDKHHMRNINTCNEALADKDC